MKCVIVPNKVTSALLFEEYDHRLESMAEMELELLLQRLNDQNEPAGGSALSEKLDLTRFEKKMVIRNMEEKDINKIIELQKDCFPGMEPWEPEHLISHLAHFPEGQFCAEYEGEIIGSCSSLIINFDEYDDRHTWQDITDDGYITNHNPDGLNLYGIEVMVHPEYRRMKIGHRLYEARKDLARRLNLKSIIIGGRIPNYHKYAEEMTARAYVEQVTRHQIYDPVLSFQLMNGFTLMRINPNYLPDDTASIKYATLMQWNNVDYLPQSKRYYKSAFPVRICVIQYEMKRFTPSRNLPIRLNIMSMWLPMRDLISRCSRRFSRRAHVFPRGAFSESGHSEDYRIYRGLYQPLYRSRGEI